MSKSSARLQENLELSFMPGLNGARAIAALAVVLYHWTPLLHHPAAISGLFPGPYAVIFFFVLSGFLITTLLLREEKRDGAINLHAFWVRRFLRILPAFYVYLAIQALLIGKLPGDFVAAGLYLSNYYQAFRGWMTSLVGHTWSLSVEEQFYILWPIAFVFVSNRQLLKKILVVGIISVQLLRVLANHFGIPFHYSYFAFEFRSDALMIGCWMAIHLKENPQVPGWMLNRYLPVFLLAVFPILMAPYQSHFINDRVLSPFGYTIGTYASALLIVQAVAFAPKFLDNKVMNYLGALSYSIYLYHQTLLDLSRNLIPYCPRILVVVIYVFGTVGAASISYFLVEKPFLKLKTRMEAVRKRRTLPETGPTVTVPASSDTRPFVSV